jgi:hypothetical protein
MVEQPEIQAGGEGLGERVDEELEALGIEVRQCQEAPLSGRRGHRARDIPPLEDVLHRADGWHTAGGEAPATHRQQAEAAFVLTEHAYRLGVDGWDDALQPLSTTRLKRPEGFRLFWCGWAAAP